MPAVQHSAVSVELASHKMMQPHAIDAIMIYLLIVELRRTHESQDDDNMMMMRTSNSHSDAVILGLPC
jgi:hypothetical protein